MDRTDSPARVLVAQIGARRHYLVPRALEQCGLLEQFMTDACVNISPWRWFDTKSAMTWTPKAVRRFFGRRIHGVPEKKIFGFPLFALSATWDRGREPAAVRWARRNANFAKLVVDADFGKANTVYAFNGAALEIFEDARSRGLGRILDQTSAPQRWNRELLVEECRRWPGWENEPEEIGASEVLSRREEREWELADRIVCGSEFAVNALSAIGGPRKKCVVVNAPTETREIFGRAPQRRDVRNRKVRILFVGTLQLLKGIQYLAEALRQLPPGCIEARLVGLNRLSEKTTESLARDFEIVGSVPRSEMAAHYQWADIFVLPTLSEGSANVCREAMAAGLPVITTPNAGSTAKHEVHGLIVPAADPAALASAIARLASDQELCRRLERAAFAHASEQSFESYAKALADVVAGAHEAAGGLLGLPRNKLRASSPSCFSVAKSQP